MGGIQYIGLVLLILSNARELLGQGILLFTTLFRSLFFFSSLLLSVSFCFCLGGKFCVADL